MANPLPEFLAKGKKFIADYKVKFNVEPGPYSALSYDRMYLLSDALRRAGSTDKKKLIAALQETKAFAGLSGPVTLDGLIGIKRPDVFTAIRPGGPDRGLNKEASTG